MDTRRHDTLSAIAARQRGRARLRAATLAFGAAGLAGAGVVAYNLPGGSHPAATPSAAQAGPVHASSGGSATISRQPANRSGAAAAPSASSGPAHATSGGS